MPAELSLGLLSVGKLPSGIALQLLLQPMTELLGRYRDLFEDMIEELVSKTISMEYMLQGKAIPEFELEIETNETIFPEDKEKQIAEIVLLHKEGLLPKEQAQQLLEPILDIKIEPEFIPLPTISGVQE